MKTPVVAGLVLLALAGCGRKQATDAGRVRDAALDAPAAGPRPTVAVLDSVQVELHGRVERVLDPRALGRSLARCLIEGGAPVEALAEQAPPDRVVRHLALTLAITVHEPTAEHASLGVSLDAAGRWRDDVLAAAPTVSLTGAATPRTDALPAADAADAAAAAVVLELEPRLCVELAARIQSWADDDLGPTLAAIDPAQVRWGLQLAAERPAPADELARVTLINAIAPHLGGDAPVRDAAIAALAASRDPRAVAALTAITDVGDETTLVRIIDAVARLGGDDARDYLQVMVSHRDRAVARAARAGLASMNIAVASPRAP